MPSLPEPYLYVFTALEQTAWFAALRSLRTALTEQQAAEAAYARLFRALSETGHCDLPSAAAQGILWQDSSLSHYPGALGLKQAALKDLHMLQAYVSFDWQKAAQQATEQDLPGLTQLTPPSLDKTVHTFAQALSQQDAATVLELLLTAYRQNGTGELARFQAFRWQEGDFKGIAHPVDIDLARLVSLDRQISMLEANTLSFLTDKPAQHTLLYGSRGTGKSTAVRGLLNRYGAQGLRLVEVQPHDLKALPDITERLRNRPHKYILFVDDLSFESGDSSYGPLKTVLEGSLTARPANTLIYATSNRRHLVKEGFSDRPDPLNDDVHGWDTQNEKLALSDRFGLTITFPTASQKRYVEVVKGLLEHEGLNVKNIDARAVQFADWGNGYSGRTAQQFVDTLKSAD